MNLKLGGDQMSYVEIGDQHVKEILRFLKKIGFKDVNGGSNFIMGSRQVDACGGHENTLLIIECTTQEDINSKVTYFRGNLSNIIHGFKSHEKYKSYKRYVPILAVKYQKVTDTHLKHALESKGRKIHIWDNNFVLYYLNLQSSIGNYAKYNLLADIEIQPESTEMITYPAFVTSVGPQGRYKLFLFFVEAKDLLKYAYVARRESGYESFYQRMVRKDRLLEIARKYIQERKRMFPNSIVVAFGKNSWKFDSIPALGIEMPKWLEIGKITLLNNYRSCWIIDGQHRLYSYAHTTVPGYLAVSAFAKINEEQQADYFLDINREAKPVDPNLLWDLAGSLNPNSTKGRISNAIKGLFDIKDGFFEDNIKIPSKGRGKFNFNNICVSVERNYLAEGILAGLYKEIKNPFWDKDYRKFEQNISKGLNQYFTFFSNGLDEEKQVQIFSDGLVSVLIELFKLLIAYLEKKPNEDDLKKFFKPLCEFISVLSEEEINKIKKSLSSEAGKKDFRNDLIRILQEGYKKEFAKGIIKEEPSLAQKINELEFKLNKFVNSILRKNIGSNWIENQKYFPNGQQRKICLEKSKKFKRPPWVFINFLTTINAIILSNELWGRFFKDIFISHNRFMDREEFISVAKRLWDYRSNKLGHERGVPIIYSKDQENLIQSQYNIFNSVIEKEDVE